MLSTFAWRAFVEEGSGNWDISAINVAQAVYVVNIFFSSRSTLLNKITVKRLASKYYQLASCGARSALLFDQAKLATHHINS